MSRFTLDMKRFVEKAGKNADLAVRKVLFDIDSRVAFRTPVDSGRLRANWVASIDSPYSGQLSATQRKDYSGVINQAAGKVFYLTNNLPYAAVVEFGLYGSPPGSANGPKTTNGFSKQAPAGMVGITIAEIKAKYSL